VRQCAKIWQDRTDHRWQYWLVKVAITRSKFVIIINFFTAIFVNRMPPVLRYRYSVIQKYELNWTVNGDSTHTWQLVAVFQVLCSLYGLTCVGSLEIVSRSPLIHVVGRRFCLYTDSLFVQIGDSNDKCCSSLEAECWNEDETHAAQQSATQFWLNSRTQKKFCAT